MKATVKNGQSLADFAVEHFGAWTALIDIALMNAIPMSEIPPSGTELELPEQHYNVQMEQYCKRQGVSPATEGSTMASANGIFTIQFTQQFT